MFHYNALDVRNMFIGRKGTITLIRDLKSRMYYHTRYIVYESNNELSNCLTKSNHYQIRINWFYLAKYLSRPKYSLIYTVSSTSKPRTSLLIILLLLMCGDIGASINPGPRTDCSYCNELISSNSRFLTCQQCNMKVHLKCNISESSSHFLCNLCTYNF